MRVKPLNSLCRDAFPLDFKRKGIVLGHAGDGRQNFPLRVWCEFDLRCNADCIFWYNHCRDGISQAPKVAPTSVILNSLTELFRLPVTSVALSGGEITVRKDVAEIVRHCAKAGIASTIVSNGILLTEKRVAELTLSGANEFQVTLHGSKPEIHDFITRKSSWKTVLTNLVSMREHEIPVTLVFVACHQNIGDFANVVEIAAVLGCSEIIFNQTLTTTGAASSNRGALSCSEEPVVKALSEANMVAQEYNLTIRLGTPYLFNRDRIGHLSNLSGGHPRDRRRLDQVTMDAFGNIRACSQSSINLGNVSAPEALMAAFRAAPSKQELATEECTCLNLRYPNSTIGSLRSSSKCAEH